MRFLRTTFGGKFFLATAVLAIILLSACQSAPENQSAFTSTAGVKVESLIPADSFIVIKAGTADPLQLQNLNEILKKFPDEDWKNFETTLVGEIDKDLSADGLSYENDIKPMIGDHLQAMMAISGKLNRSSAPDIVVAIALADPLKAQLLLEKSLKEGGQKQSYKSYEIYFDKDKKSYFALYSDVLLVTDRIALMEKALDGAGSGQDCLLNNPTYQKNIQKMQGAIGFFYMDTQKYFSGLEDMAPEPAMTQIFDNDILKAIKSEVFAVYAEKDGFGIGGYVYIDEKAIRDSKTDFFSMESEPAYLYGKIPLENPFIYEEGYSMSKVIKRISEIYKDLKGFDKVSKSINDGLLNVGIDPEKDLLSFLDKGFAFEVSDGGAMIPSVAFYIDAGSNPDGAKKVLSKIYDTVQQALSQNKDQDAAKMIKHEKKEEGGGLKYTLDVNLKAAEDTGNNPFDSFGIGYGLNADNLLYFGLNMSDKEGQKTLDQNPEFIKAKNHISGFDVGLGYFETAPLIAYADRMVDYLGRNGTMSQQDKDIYARIKKYIMPVKSIIFSSSRFSGDLAEMRGFVRIE